MTSMVGAMTLVTSIVVAVVALGRTVVLRHLGVAVRHGSVHDDLRPIREEVDATLVLVIVDSPALV